MPPRQQLETLHALVGARRIGVIYNPAETALVVAEARRAARRAGLELVPIEVHDSKDVLPALEKLDASIEALWSVADRTVLARGIVERVLLHTVETGLPFMGLSPQYVRAGALLAISTSYEENGRQAARLVEQVLAGRPAGSLPVSIPEQIAVVFNPRTAERLDLEFERASHASFSLRPVR